MHSVEAALKNPARKVNRLVLTENAERRLVQAMGKLAHTVEYASPRDLDKILGADAVHQGAMLETEQLVHLGRTCREYEHGQIVRRGFAT